MTAEKSLYHSSCHHRSCLLLNGGYTIGFIEWNGFRNHTLFHWQPSTFESTHPRASFTPESAFWNNSGVIAKPITPITFLALESPIGVKAAVLLTRVSISAVSLGPFVFRMDVEVDGPRLIGASTCLPTEKLTGVLGDHVALDAYLRKLLEDDGVAGCV